MAARIAKREDLEVWLQGKPPEQAVAIAVRAALRALPGLVAAPDGTGARRFADLTLATFRASALARVAAVYPTRANEVRAAAARAAAASYAAAAARAAAAAYAAAAYAAAYAADAAAAAAAYAADAAAAAAAAYAADAAAAAMWSQVEADARVLESGGVASLMRLTLWVGPEPEWAAGNWTRLKSGLREQDRWSFWIAWYEAVLAGRPLWPELDAKAREDLGVKICLIDDDVWAEGAAHVNGKIEEMIAEARQDDFAPLEGLPSPNEYGWTANRRIGVVAGPQNEPHFEYPTSEADHRAFLAACRTLAQRLIADLSDRKYDNVRPEFLDALRHYADDIPSEPGQGNFVLADGEMRGVRSLFEAEAETLPSGFASRLRSLIEQHMALRPFYPEIERLYQTVARGKSAPPPPLANIQALDQAVIDNTPQIFEPEVSKAIKELQRTPPPVELPAEDARPVDGVIRPPKDPVQTPPTTLTHAFQRAANINKLASVIKSTGEFGKGLAGWAALVKIFSDIGPAIFEWLKHFL